MIGRWLDRSPVWILVVIAIMLAIAPSLEAPHLLEKLQMVLEGTLTRPVDFFDLLLHSSGILILLLKLNRMVRKPAKNDGSEGDISDLHKESIDNEHKG